MKHYGFKFKNRVQLLFTYLHWLKEPVDLIVVEFLSSVASSLKGRLRLLSNFPQSCFFHSLGIVFAFLLGKLPLLVEAAEEIFNGL